MPQQQQIALITGANKGIGFETARQLGRRGVLVLIGARDGERVKRAVSSLVDQGVSAAPLLMDVTDDVSISRSAGQIAERYGRLDILINNAGISGGAGPVPSAVGMERMSAVYAVNVFGVVAVTNAVLPLLRKSTAGRIVNVSSSMGSLTLASDPKWEYSTMNVMAYQSSKAALNAISICYAKELRASGIKVNAADPGYADTDFNDHRGHRSVEQAATIVVRLATLSDDGPTGTFQDEYGSVPW